MSWGQLDLFSTEQVIPGIVKTVPSIHVAPQYTLRVTPAAVEVPLDSINKPQLTDWQKKLAMPVTVLGLIAKQLSDNAKHPCRMCKQGGGTICYRGRLDECRCFAFQAHEVALELQYGSMDNTEGATPLGYAGEYGFCN